MLTKYQSYTIIGLVLLAFAQWLGIPLGLWTLSEVLAIVPYFIFTAMFGVFLWGLRESIESKLGKGTTTTEKAVPYKPDPDLPHFGIYYLRIKGAPDTPLSSPLRYITNDRIRAACQVRELPEWIASPVKEHKITWYPYDDKNDLKKVLSVTYAVYDTAPLPEGFGLRFIEGKWIEYAPHSELLSKLAGRRFENLLVLNLTRKRFRSKVRRTLIIKFLKTEAKSGIRGEAWLALPYIFELVEEGLIAEETKEMWFWQSCERWCKRHHYSTEHLDRRFPESALLAEGV
jgi:hypothetical protein